MDKRLIAGMFFLLLTALVLQTVLSMRDKSATFDEPAHAIRGYYFLKTGNTMVYGHPPLMHLLTIPFLAFENIRLPENHNELYLKNHIHPLADLTFFHSGNDADRLLFLARLPVVILSVILGIFVFKFAKELYGAKAGLFALFLYSFNPVVISMSGMITTDIAVALFSFLAVYSYWTMLRKQTKASVVVAGLMFGLAIGSKTVSVLLVPVFAVLGLVHYHEMRKKKENISLGRLFSGFLVVLIIGYLIISSLYGFKGSFKSLSDNINDDSSEYVSKEKFSSAAISSMIVPWDGPVRNAARLFIEKVPIMIPYPFLKEVWSTTVIANLEPSSFLLGKNSTHFWYFLPVTFIVKLHLLILFSLFLSIFYFRKIRAKNVTAELALILPFVSLLVFFIFFPLDGGVRYLLPGLPFLFVFVSRVVKIAERIKIVAIITLLLGIWYVISALTIFPHHFAYFNELAGGPENGYKVSVGGNLDLGENMIRLKKYMDEKGIEKIKFSYEGASNPEYYGINYDYLPSASLSYGQNITKENCEPTTGIIVASASNIQGLYLKNKTCLGWLKGYKPIGKIGYSLFIYNITNNITGTNNNITSTSPS